MLGGLDTLSVYVAVLGFICRRRHTGDTAIRHLIPPTGAPVWKSVISEAPVTRVDCHALPQKTDWLREGGGKRHGIV